MGQKCTNLNNNRTSRSSAYTSSASSRGSNSRAKKSYYMLSSDPSEKKYKLENLYTPSETIDSQHQIIYNPSDTLGGNTGNNSLQLAPPHYLAVQPVEELCNHFCFFITLNGIKCIGLNTKETNGATSSCFVTINWDDFAFYKKTHTIADQQNPEWPNRYQFHWTVSSISEMSTRQLTLTVFRGGNSNSQQSTSQPTPSTPRSHPSLHSKLQQPTSQSFSNNSNFVNNISSNPSNTSARTASKPPPIEELGSCSVLLLTAATGPIHHDLLLIPPNNGPPIGRITFDISMSQICQLIINPIEVLVHIHEKLKDDDEEDDDNKEDVNDATNNQDPNHPSQNILTKGSNKFENLNHHEDTHFENKKKSSISSSTRYDPLYHKSRPSINEEDKTNHAIHKSSKSNDRSCSINSQNNLTNSSSINSDIAFSLSSSEKDSEIEEVNSNNESKYSILNSKLNDSSLPHKNDQDSSSNSTPRSTSPQNNLKSEVNSQTPPSLVTNGDEQEHMNARWQLSFIPTGVDNPAEFFSKWTEPSEQPYWNTIDHSLLLKGRGGIGMASERNYNKSNEKAGEESLSSSESTRSLSQSKPVSPSSESTFSSTEYTWLPPTPKIAPLTHVWNNTNLHLDVKETYEKLATICRQGHLVSDVLYKDFPTIQLVTSIEQLRQNHLRLNLYSRQFPFTKSKFFGETWLPFFKIYDAYVVDQTNKHFFDSYFMEKIWYDGKCIGHIEGIIVFQNNPIFRQMYAGVHSDIGYKPISPPILGAEHKSVKFNLRNSASVPEEIVSIASQHKMLLESLYNISQHNDQEAVSSLVAPVKLFNHYMPPKTDANHHQQLQNICENLLKLLKKYDTEFSRSYHYTDGYALLTGQRVLLNLANHVLEYNEIIPWQYRGTYGSVLHNLLRRGELSIGSCHPSIPIFLHKFSLSEIWLIYQLTKKLRNSRKSTFVSPSNSAFLSSLAPMNGDSMLHRDSSRISIDSLDPHLSTQPLAFSIHPSEINNQLGSSDLTPTNQQGNYPEKGREFEVEEAKRYERYINEQIIDKILTVNDFYSGLDPSIASRLVFEHRQHTSLNNQSTIMNEGTAKEEIEDKISSSAFSELISISGGSTLYPQFLSSSNLPSDSTNTHKSNLMQHLMELSQKSMEMSAESIEILGLFHKRMKLCRQYFLLLHRMLYYALQKLCNDALAEGQGKYITVYLCISYFRLPVFRDEFLKLVLPEEDVYKKIEEWRGTEYSLDGESILENLDWPSSETEVRPLFDWTCFHEHLRDYFGEDALMSSLRNLKEKTPIPLEWESQIKKRGNKFFSYLEQWSRHVYQSVNRKDLHWQLIPGYLALLKAFLLEMKQRDVEKYPDSLLNCSGAMLANERLLSVFIKVLFLKTSVYKTSAVFSALDYIDYWMQVLGMRRQLLPPNFDFNFLKKGLDIILGSELCLNVSKGLWFLYKNLHFFQGEHLQVIVIDLLLKKYFVPIFLNWSWLVRRSYMWFLFYRVCEGTREILGRWTSSHIFSLDEKIILLAYSELSRWLKVLNASEIFVSTGLIQRIPDLIAQGEEHEDNLQVTPPSKAHLTVNSSPQGNPMKKSSIPLHRITQVLNNSDTQSASSSNTQSSQIKNAPIPGTSQLPPMTTKRTKSNKNSSHQEDSSSGTLKNTSSPLSSPAKQADKISSSNPPLTNINLPPLANTEKLISPSNNNATSKISTKQTNFASPPQSSESSNFSLNSDKLLKKSSLAQASSNNTSSIEGLKNSNFVEQLYSSVETKPQNMKPLPSVVAATHTFPSNNSLSTAFDKAGRKVNNTSATDSLSGIDTSSSTITSQTSSKTFKLNPNHGSPLYTDNFLETTFSPHHDPSNYDTQQSTVTSLPGQGSIEEEIHSSAFRQFLAANLSSLIGRVLPQDISELPPENQTYLKVAKQEFQKELERYKKWVQSGVRTLPEMEIPSSPLDNNVDVPLDNW